MDQTEQKIIQFVGKLVPRTRVAKMLNVNPCTLRVWELQKKLSPVRIGKRVFYRLEDVSHYLKLQ